MADICDYRIKVKGQKNACYAFIENGRKTPCFSYGDIRPGFATYI